MTREKQSDGGKSGGRKFPGRLVILVCFILSVAAVIAGLLYHAGWIGPEKGEMLSYPDFMDRVDRGDIIEVTLSDRDILSCRDRQGRSWRFQNPDYEEFKKDLLQQGRDLKIRKGMNAVPADRIISLALNLLMAGISLFMLLSVLRMIRSNSGKSSGGMIGRIFGGNDSDVLQVSESDTNLTFQDVGGLHEVKKELQYIVDFMKNPRKYALAGAKPPRGILFMGEPGCGKTLLARALARECGVPFFYVSASSFQKRLVGAGEDAVREMFRKVSAHKQAILFIDEIDSVGMRRGAHNNHHDADAILNELLVQLDGFVQDESAQLLVIGATNRAEDLDPALLRTGRFDKKVGFPLPDRAERKEILDIAARNKDMSGTSLEAFLRLTAGMSGSDIVAVVNNAAILAAMDGRSVLTNGDMQKAYGQYLINGYEKEGNKNRSAGEDLLIAWHEAGHAVMSRLLHTKVGKVTINGTTSGAGGFTMEIPQDALLHSRRDLENRVRIAYAGRAAEELYHQDDPDMISTGASGDIRTATKTIIAMIGVYGMGESGMLDLSVLNGRGMDGGHTVRLTDRQKSEAEALASRLYQETKELLGRHREILSELVCVLMRKRTIYMEELDEIIRKKRIQE